MKYWMTQSLLSNWIYFLDADDERTYEAMDSFLRTLRRERSAPTQAMLDGVEFERMVNEAAAGLKPAAPKRPMRAETEQKWARAATIFGNTCMGGQPQTPLTVEATIDGMDFVLYGIADYIKAGTIYDIKKVSQYQYGKYAHSPQHPMYLELCPEASKFTYLIFDGTNLYRETYRCTDCTSIFDTIHRFMLWLTDEGLISDYKRHWMMNASREQKCNGVYQGRQHAD